MRPTRLGLSVLAADAFAFFGGLLSGNNLIYLVAGLLLASLGAAVLLARRNLAGIDPSFELPEPVYQGAPFELGVRLFNSKRRPAYQVAAAGPRGRGTVDFLPGRSAAVLEIPAVLPHRGRHRVDDLVLETVFPFGLFRVRRKIRPFPALAFPRVYEIYGRETSPSVHEDRTSVPRRGVGDDFYGIRDYAPGEDARLINWKLSAKTGKPLVKEYAETVGNRVTVSVREETGPGAEERISEAASLAKFFIDAGADVRLVTGEGEIPYGRGLLHLRALLEKLALLGAGKEARGMPPAPRPSEPPPFAPPSAVAGPMYAATAAAYGSLFLIEEMNPLILLLGALMLPLGWLFDRRESHPLPAALLDAGALVVLLAAVFVGMPRLGMIRTVAVLLFYVLLYFLWTPKNERAVKRILLADFLLFFLASSQAVDLTYFPLFCLFFFFIGWWLVRWRDLDPRPRRPRGWFRGLGAVQIRCLIAAAFLFVLLPRPYSARMQQLLASAGLSRFQNPAFSFAGLSDRVDLGFFGPLRKNSARALQIRYIDAPAGFTPPGVLRVRAAAFDRLQGRRWLRSETEFAVRYGDLDIPSREGLFRVRNRHGRIELPGFDPERPGRTVEVVVFPMITAFVFAPGGIGALETEYYAASFDVNDTVYFPNLYVGSVRYRARLSGDDPVLSRSIGDYDRILRERFLRLDAVQPRWSQWAKARTSRQTTPADKARALERYFQTRFSYSLSAADNRQDLDSFLFRTQSASCEYFASAMVLLLRHLGIPSRLVVGFLATEWNEYGQFYDVRQNGAHAWVEAYLPGRGWTTFDPTPPDFSFGGSGGLFGVLWEQITKSVDALEARWYRYVVGYDSDTQKSLFYNLSLGLGRHVLIVGIIVLGAAALAAVGIFFKPRRFLRARRERRRRSDHFYYAVLDRLEKSGFRRPAWRTAREFAASVVFERPDLAPIIGLTDLFDAVRYGGRPLTAGEAETAAILASRLSEALRGRGGVA